MDRRYSLEPPLEAVLTGMWSKYQENVTDYQLKYDSQEAVKGSTMLYYAYHCPTVILKFSALTEILCAITL